MELIFISMNFLSRAWLACYMSEHIFESWVKPWIFSCHFKNFERTLVLKIGFVDGTYCPKSWVGMCKASSAHSMWYDELESRFVIAPCHSLRIVNLSLEKNWATFCIIRILDSSLKIGS